MNIEELILSLREMPIDHENPLRPLDKIFGDSSLERWFELGFADALKAELKHQRQVFDKFRLKYYPILNEIIPRLPRSYEEMLGDQFDFKQKSNRSLSNPVLLDELISKIMCDLQYRSTSDYKTLYIKVIYHATTETLSAKPHNSQDGYFYYSSKFSVSPFCDETSHTFMLCVIILSDKFKDMDFKHSAEVILIARHIIATNLESTCPLVNELKNTYEKYNFENMLEIQVPAWINLLETCQKFETSDVTSALTILSGVIAGFDIRFYLQWEMQIWQSGVMIHLTKLFTNSDMDERAISNIKTFLNIFQEVIGDDGLGPVSIFESLKDHVSGNLRSSSDYLLCLKTRGGSMHGYESLTKIKEYEKMFIEDIYTSLHLLQCLYVLNKSWYQWFDIVDQTRICSFKYFMNQPHEKLLITLLNDRGSCETAKDMIQLFPAFSREMLNNRGLNMTYFNDFPRQGDAIIFKDISRNNVLSDVMTLFDKNLDDIKKRWIFTFDGEPAIGTGTTKEVYKLLSQELQKRELNLWRDEASPIDSLYAYSPNGLFPKPLTENLKLFEFIGKLLAKVAWENILLDIPLSDELFRQLKPMRYSHLRKDYYDIPTFYPTTKQLISQLISIKRQKDSILQSDSSLTDSQKHVLIENLRFDDGISFQDLFLNFTIPGTEIELIESGKDIIVSVFNFEDYMKKLTLKQVIPLDQLQAIKNGFETIFPGGFNLFTLDQLNKLTYGDFKMWDEKYLINICKFSNGYNGESNPVKFLFQVLASFSDNEQKMFLEFTIGFPLLYRVIGRPLTISKYMCDDADNTLPYSSTCKNILFLPEYSSLKITKQKLTYAIVEGRRSFHDLKF